MMVEPSKVGVRRCVKCGWLFISRDIDRIRRCLDCKNSEDEYEPRRASGVEIQGKTTKADG